MFEEFVSPPEAGSVDAGDEEVVDLFWSEACAVCQCRFGLKAFFGDVACFFDWYVGEQ